MPKTSILNGTVHKTPPDLRQALLLSKKSQATWEDITPLARNEWICWIQSVKREETRKEHIQRALQDLGKGKRRPCCWYGCTHRKDKAISSSQKYVLSRQSQKRSKRG